MRVFTWPVHEYFWQDWVLVSVQLNVFIKASSRPVVKKKKKKAYICIKGYANLFSNQHLPV
jgi:hypothetical protein